VSSYIKTVAALLMVCVSAGAESGLEQPQLGMMLDRHGAARPVYGVTASVTLGDPAATDVLAIACSRRMCLMKTDSAILASGGAIPATPAPRGPALVALDGASAFIYFIRTKQLARRRGGQFDPIPFELPGGVISDEILSIAAGPSGTLDAAFRRDGLVSIARITLADGNVIVTGSLPGDTVAVLLTRSGIVLADRNQITLRRPDGSDLSFPLAGAQAIFQLGERYVQIRAGDLDYALRLDPGHEQLFLLPEPGP
jgi:hypothetical protein